MEQCVRTGWILMVCLPAGSIAAAPLGTGFTYQGQLKQGGQPVNAIRQRVLPDLKRFGGDAAR